MNSITIGDNTIEIQEHNNQTLINGLVSNYEIVPLSDIAFKVLGSNKIWEVEVVETAGKNLTLHVNGQPVEVKVSDHIDQILEKLGMDTSQTTVVKEVKAPMPGSIMEIVVSEGAEVKEGDPLLILEAMKMENVLKSPGDGIVDKIQVSSKQNVEKNQVLITFE